MPETETAENMEMNPKEMELETKLTQLNLAVQRSEKILGTVCSTGTQTIVKLYVLLCTHCNFRCCKIYFYIQFIILFDYSVLG
jgi:hypothetical protein